MVYHDLGYSTETIFTGVFKGILPFHRFFKAKNPSSDITHRALFLGGKGSRGRPGDEARQYKLTAVTRADTC